MFSAPNKPVIDKCILSFSHDQVASRAEADRMSIEKARREIAEGKQGISHLILRAQDDEIDQLKFLFLIHGIPIMCYALGNLLKSSLKEIVVIGSPEVETVLNRFLEVVETGDKKITFVLEDPKNLSLRQTMALGKSKLEVAPNELVLFQPGDLPFMYEIEKVLRDEDIQQHDLLLWLNSRQRMFPHYLEDPDSEFVQRNYHYRAIYEDTHELHDMKEPNVYPINLTALNSDIIDELHASRKDGKILQVAVRQAMKYPGRFLKLIRVLAKQFLKFETDLQRFRKNEKYQFGMHVDNFHKGVSALLDMTFKTKPHSDPAFVSDVDALEDWEDFESLTQHASQLHGEEGLAYIHPFGHELLRFKEVAMPELKKQLPLYRDFPAYLNRIYQTLQMNYVPFDSAGKYISPNANNPKVAVAFDWYSHKCEALKVQSGQEI